MCHHAQYGRYSLKSVVIDRGEPLELCPFSTGPWLTPKTSPLNPYVLHRKIWSFCVKGCMHKYKRTPKIEERWVLPFKMERCCPL